MKNSSWFKASPKWAWTDDMRLQQNGTVQHAAREGYNMFGGDLSRP